MEKEGENNSKELSPNKLSIEINGETKDFTVEDIKGLLSKQVEVEQFKEKLSPILKTLDKFDVDPETFVQQAEGSFAVTRKLIEAGLIDEETGEIINKKEPPKSEPTGIVLPALGSSAEKTLEIVRKAIVETVAPLRKQLEVLEREQLGLLRENISQRVRARYPDFSDREVSELLSRASADPKRDLWTHAEKLKEDLSETNEKMELVFAKKYGVDLEAARNKLKEQDDGGGGSLSFMKGKKLSFKRGPGSITDKDAVTPRQAMVTFMKKQMGVK